MRLARCVAVESPFMARQPSVPASQAWSECIARIKSELSLKATVETLTGARFSGHGQDFKCLCPFHNERTPSFAVSERRGQYRCFGAGCGARGDVIEFIRQWEGLSFVGAVARACELGGLPHPHGVGGKGGRTPAMAYRSAEEPAKLRSPLTLDPIAERLLPVAGRRIRVIDQSDGRIFNLKPEFVHVFRAPNGAALCVVLRMVKRGGGKFFVQAVRTSEAAPIGWKLLRFGRSLARPVYGLEDLGHWEDSASRSLLIVEGETTRDAAWRLLAGLPRAPLPLSTLGGGGAVQLVDWDLIVDAARRVSRPGARTHIFIWPDADNDIRMHDGTIVDRQANQVRKIADALIAAGCDPEHSVLQRVAPPTDVANSWDLADAERDGWSGQHVLDHLRRSSTPLHDS